jgi:hypothetical protein
MKPVYKIATEKSGFRRKTNLFLRFFSEYPAYDREPRSASRPRPASRGYSEITGVIYLARKRSGEKASMQVLL